MNLRSPLLLLLLLLILASCGTTRKSRPEPVRPITTRVTAEKPTPAEDNLEVPGGETSTESSSLAQNIIDYAQSFLGTRYRFGGTTEKGMDCSGLVFTAFMNENIALPRISREMALLGTSLSLEDVTVGDLLFFETDPRKKSITHVGLVVQADEEDIFFIHSSTSLGVIITRLSEAYWQRNFVLAKRVL